MKSDIIIGMEDDGDKTKGIYRFLWQAKSRANPRRVKDIVDKENGTPIRGGISCSKKPYLELMDNEAAQTPRQIVAFDKSLYCLTRSRLAIIIPDSGNLSISSNDKLSDILTGVVSKNKFKNIVDKAERTEGALAVTPRNSLFFALFLSDKLKRELWDPDPNESDEEKGGYLFHSPDGQLNNLVEMRGYFPTGMVAADERRVLVPCGPVLKELAWDPNTKIYSPAGEFEMQGNILTAALLGDYTVCTDNKEGFAVGYKNNWTNLTHQKIAKASSPQKEFSYFNDNFLQGNEQNFLPSEATSAAIVKQQENGGTQYYLFLGVDDGKLIIYNLSRENDRPAAKYNKTVSFLSLEKMVNEANKDNHLWNMKVIGDYLNFTVRDMYIRVGVNQILRHEPKNRINVEEESGKEGKYLLALQEKYGLDRICKVPHRIRSWDYIK